LAWAGAKADYLLFQKLKRSCFWPLWKLTASRRRPAAARLLTETVDNSVINLRGSAAGPRPRWRRHGWPETRQNPSIVG
jgi:hypothetical protein